METERPLAVQAAQATLGDDRDAQLDEQAELLLLVQRTRRYGRRNPTRAGRGRSPRGAWPGWDTVTSYEAA
jgi:hypothetical protein